MIDPLKYIDNTVVGVNEVLGKTSRPVLKRYPLLFGTLTTFGAMFFLYGFERWADRIPIISRNPETVMLLGIAVLLFTGQLYKTLGHNEKPPKDDGKQSHSS